MLSSSAIAYGYDLNIEAIADPTLPSGIPGGNELLDLVDAVMSGDRATVETAQTAVIDALDADSLADAASVFGNFEMMNRVAEGSGIPIPQQAIDRMRDTIESLGLAGFLKSSVYD